MKNVVFQESYDDPGYEPQMHRELLSRLGRIADALEKIEEAMVKK